MKYQLNHHALVYLEISIDSLPVGRLELELFANTPKASEFFRKLCTSEISNRQGQMLSLVDTKIDKIQPGFIVQGGNVPGMINMQK